MKTKHQTVQVATGGQIKELASAIVEAIPSNIAADTAQYWIGKKKKLAAEIKKVLIGANPYADLIADWENFYRDLFGIKTDFSNLQIPEKQQGFDRLIVVAQGMTPQRLYDKCKELFPCWKWTEDLNEAVSHSDSDRTTKDGSYTIWIRDRVEADEELKNLSANQLEQGIPITLEERLVYELKYFKETGKHLDIKNVTLCTGSRYSDGYVPRVDWGEYDGELRVGWVDPDYSLDCLRSRSAVS